ncbi:hypothetical protein BP5796_06088 [Coleophoma crateriformis]|uniref:Uncharacterized protein n=1 Tax=Coleophoma crateriformis TaxID=565419 RepID=A0A3D8RW77_9HELO|nr:hypothetical protein BP5796_06088 [Coleophoma crateriformis]
MGIQGLLPLLKSIHKPCNLRKFEGKTLGVDAYGWLHRGTVACAMDLAMGNPTRKSVQNSPAYMGRQELIVYRFIDFCMHRVRMLQHFGVTPFLIFDGDYLPSKAATEADRRKRREDSKRAGMELQRSGKVQQAYLEFQKSVDVSPFMARQLIDELKQAGVQYIVAPYEADAQMVYLERIGVIDGILSEDSDLLVFGAKCLLTKLDQYGECVEINKADFCACKEITLTGWSDVEFRRMAILSGCDYLASINNMGLKTAYRMVRKHKTIEKVIRMLQFDGKHHVPNGYLEAYYQAELTFLHQRVFCPKSETIVFHTEPDQQIDDEKMPFIGAYVEPEIARGVARGDLDPMTKLPIVIPTKNKMVTSSSPWTTPRPKPRQSMTSTDIKKGTPIDRYFKRTPLAELPLNVFSMSPSQEELLRRQPGDWTANPAPASLPRPSVRRSSSSPLVTSPQSAPPLLRTGTTRSRTSILPEPRPSKRARMCEGEQTLSPVTGKKIELVASPFFSKYEPSPTAGRVTKNRRSKKEDFHIFSDDSVEDAMLSLPDFDGFDNSMARPQKKIAIFNESKDQNVKDSLRDEAESKSTQQREPYLTPATSAASSAEQPSTSSDYDLPAPRLGLREKFSFSAGQSTPLSQRDSQLPLTPVSIPPQRRSRIPLAVKNGTAPPVASVSTMQAKLTPLQRLRTSATSRRHILMTPPSTPLHHVETPLPREITSLKDQSSEQKADVDPASIPLPTPDESENIALAVPASIPLPIADEAEIVALAMPNGSEDMIIHDSEADEDALLSEPETESRGNVKVVDFQRFAYVR